MTELALATSATTGVFLNAKGSMPKGQHGIVLALCRSVCKLTAPFAVKSAGARDDDSSSGRVAVKGGQCPAKRTLDGNRNANTLKGLGLVAGFRSQPPSQSGGEDFPAFGGGARVGGIQGIRHGTLPNLRQRRGGG